MLSMRLLEPITINGMEMQNRVVLTAMVTRLSGADGFVNENIRERYLRFARGEPGLIVVEAMGVHAAKSGPLLRLSDDKFIPGLRDLAKEVHDISPSKIVPQIIHFLKIARSGWRQRVRDLTKEDIRLIIVAYGDAAHRARVAGFDGVELHMAHAYTLSSFLSLRNKRPDEYGASLENRMRLMGEVIARCREKVGEDFPIGVRFDGEECIKNGYTVEDSKELALRMAMLGVNYISISAGGKFEDAIKKEGEPLYPYTGYSGDRCMPSATYPAGDNVYLAEGIKGYINSKGYTTPVITTGKIPTPDFAESILQAGKADLIGMARALLADPDWVKKAKKGRADTIIRCVYGNVCKNLDENFKTVFCTLWPRGKIQAPTSSDDVAPEWPNGGRLEARPEAGRILLSWDEATDNEEIYGYEIFRSRNDEPFDHHTAVRSVTRKFADTRVVGGDRYSYYVKAYDLAGNRSPATQTVVVDFPIGVPLPVGEPLPEIRCGESSPDDEE
ncbi:MAG: NADH:flavin oxidoreductase [Planctomycetota bacterium]|nr:NADH:flavin oxidoreductase [Planctomycetota bacterium]